MSGGDVRSERPSVASCSLIGLPTTPRRSGSETGARPSTCTAQRGGARGSRGGVHTGRESTDARLHAHYARAHNVCPQTCAHLPGTQKQTALGAKMRENSQNQDNERQRESE
eukprot:195138-Pleurochrysis_carterae.AAC.1